jgi:hypothetical protein
MCWWRRTTPSCPRSKASCAYRRMAPHRLSVWAPTPAHSSRGHPAPSKMHTVWATHLGLALWSRVAPLRTLAMPRLRRLRPGRTRPHNVQVPLFARLAFEAKREAAYKRLSASPLTHTRTALASPSSVAWHCRHRRRASPCTRSLDRLTTPAPRLDLVEACPFACGPAFLELHRIPSNRGSATTAPPTALAGAPVALESTTNRAQVSWIAPPAHFFATPGPTSPPASRRGHPCKGFWARGHICEEQGLLCES